MATGSDKSLPPSLSPSHLEKSDIEKLLQSGLADFSLRELLGAMLSNLAQAERGAYLQSQTEDKANGFYPRSLLVGSVPVEIEVPRTRSGQFRPPSLPARYQRGFSEETQSLLLGLLSASRSVSAAREALRKMGLSSSEHELEQIASSFIDELELRNSRPLDPDLLALFCDGKYVEIRRRSPQARLYLPGRWAHSRRQKTSAGLPREIRPRESRGLEARPAQLDRAGLAPHSHRGARRFLRFVAHYQEPVSGCRYSALRRAHTAQCQKSSLQNR